MVGEGSLIALSARKPRVFGRARRASTYLLSFTNGSLIAALSSGLAVCPSGVMVLSEVAASAPHGGVRWRIVSNVVCGVSRRACIPTVCTRSTYLRPVGTSLPAFSAAEIQIRQRPPLSIDSRLRFSKASASARRSCAPLRPPLYGTRAARPVAPPSFSAVRSV